MNDTLRLSQHFDSVGNMKRWSRRTGRAGFTFIELLLALGIFSVIALCLYSTFASGLRLNERAGGTDRVGREIQWTMERMARDLENLRDYDFSASDPGKKAFVGTPGSVLFLVSRDDALKAVTLTLQPPDPVQIHKILIGRRTEAPDTIMAEYAEERQTEFLIRRQREFVDYLVGDESAGKTDVLSPHVKAGSLFFQYADVSGEEDKTIEWEDIWEKDYLPYGVRIRLTFLPPEEDAREMPVTREVYIPLKFEEADTL